MTNPFNIEDPIEKLRTQTIQQGRIELGTCSPMRIWVEDRTREDIGDVEDIVESVKGFAGQIQTMAVRRLDPTNDGDVEAIRKGYHFRLLAGERRLWALKKANIQVVGVRIYPGDLSPLEAKSIELMENTQRLNMSWQESAKLLKQIHELQENIADETKTSWSQKDTATLVNKDPGGVSKDLKIAQALESIPELAECKTQHEAENLLARLEEDLIIAELAERQEKSDVKLEGIEGKRQEMISAYNLTDFFDWIREIPDETYDILEVDPPYASEFETAGSTSRKSSEVMEAIKRRGFHCADAETYPLFLAKLLSECYRVAKPNAWLLFWYAQDPWANEVYSQIISTGFLTKRIPAIWCKTLDGSDKRHVAAPDLYLGRVHETFYYARKGNAIIRDRGRTDVFHYKIPSPATRIHPTEKPRAMLAEILRTFGVPGDRVLCPFLGSGNTIHAAYDAGMKAEGCDLGETFRNSYIMRTSKWEIQAKQRKA